MTTAVLNPTTETLPKGKRMKAFFHQAGQILSRWAPKAKAVGKALFIVALFGLVAASNYGCVGASSTRDSFGNNVQMQKGDPNVEERVGPAGETMTINNQTGDFIRRTPADGSVYIGNMKKGTMVRRNKDGSNDYYKLSPTGKFVFTNRTQTTDPLTAALVGVAAGVRGVIDLGLAAPEGFANSIIAQTYEAEAKLNKKGIKTGGGGGVTTITTSINYGTTTGDQGASFEGTVTDGPITPVTYDPYGAYLLPGVVSHP